METVELFGRPRVIDFSQMMRISVGDFQTWMNLLSDAMPRGFGGMKPPEPNP